MEHNWNEKKVILLKTIEGFPIITITMRKAGRGSFYTWYRWLLMMLLLLRRNNLSGKE